MGAEQTMSIGIGQCLDLIGSFGAFASVPAVDLGKHKDPLIFKYEVEREFSAKDLTIKNLLLACGTEDGLFYPGFNAYVPEMENWNKVEIFEQLMVEGEDHNYNVGYIGLEHFIQMVFK